MISSRTCETRAGCFISAHDAKTGKEVWKFYNTPAPGEPGGDSWGGLPAERRIASSWGLPGSYDRDRKVLYWAISNPKPWTRWKRHGNIDAVPREAPSELYSNSTVALDLETGKLKWYYQHLPGDDWDLDHVHERMLVRTKVSPDPAAVKWINPNVKPGEEHDVVLDVAEAGGIWMLDRGTGQFLWATPFPYDTPDFHISNIDVDTGRTHINWDKVKKHDGDRVLVCFHNTRSFWSTAYDPRKNAIYIPYTNSCNDMTENYKSPSGFGPRRQVMAPAPIRKNTLRSRRWTSPPARSTTSTRSRYRATAQRLSPPAMCCSGVTSIAASAHSTSTAERFPGKASLAASFRPAPSPTR